MGIKLKKHIRGRLGNQFFQYAFMRAVQQKYAPDATLVLSFEDWPHLPLSHRKRVEEDYLQDYRASYQRVMWLRPSLAQTLIILAFCGMCFYYKYIVRRDYLVRRAALELRWQRFLLRHNIICCTADYYELDFSLINWQRDIYFFGHFESPRYFAEVRELVVADLQPRHPVDWVAQRWQLILGKSNTVCLHVRRGDFVESELHQVCTKQYYQRAIAKMSELVERPRFIVFSDDLEWVVQNIQLPSDTLFEFQHEQTWATHYAMRLCRHFIISNSTFSWWAQYLAQLPGGIVIAPSFWWQGQLHQDIYQEHWLLLSP